MINKLVQTAKKFLGDRFTFQPAVLIPQQKVNHQLQTLIDGHRQIKSLAIELNSGNATLFFGIKYPIHFVVAYQVSPVKIDQQDGDFIIVLREESPLRIASTSRFRKTVGKSVLFLLKRIPRFDPFRQTESGDFSITKNDKTLIIRFPATTLVKWTILTAKDLKLQKSFTPTELRFEEKYLRIGFRLSPDNESASG